ncbi:MAG TPA: site-specific integrase, partial [Pseudonocardia sp.]|nr:site-specific integrase [Pseudonocardia sp.]
MDQLTGKPIQLRETVPARGTRRETEREAEKALTRLLNQVDERRSPRTEATVNQLLDRWLDVLDVERTTRIGYVGKIEKHIRPTLGRLPVGRVKVETIEALYAQLRRCRDHCRGERFVQHRTDGEHVCDEHSARRRCARVESGDPSAECRWCARACGPHRCTPLAAGSIRVVHAILSGAFGRAVRWGWIAVSPVEQTEPPSVPRPNPRPPTAAQAALLLTEAWTDPDWGALVWFAMTTGA